jgi:hypothetical protein
MSACLHARSCWIYIVTLRRSYEKLSSRSNVHFFNGHLTLQLKYLLLEQHWPMVVTRCALSGVGTEISSVFWLQSCQINVSYTVLDLTGFVEQNFSSEAK